MFSVFSLHAKSYNYKDLCPAADRKFFMQSGQLLKLFASKDLPAARILLPAFKVVHELD